MSTHSATDTLDPGPSPRQVGTLGSTVSLRDWWKSGAPWIWLNASAVSVTLIFVVCLLGMIGWQGLSFFWPSRVVQAVYEQPGTEPIPIVGEIVSSEEVATARLIAAGFELDLKNEFYTRHLIKLGNRDVTGADFRYAIDDWLQAEQYPAPLAVIERREWGNLYGMVRAVKENAQVVAEGEAAWPAFQERAGRADDLFDQIRVIEKRDLGAINYEINELRLEERRLELQYKKDGKDPKSVRQSERYGKIEARRKELDIEYAGHQQKLVKLYADLGRDSYVFEIADGSSSEFPMAKVVHGHQPNTMSFFQRLWFFLGKLWEFVSDEPREANTEGGIFPAIFGTVMMVLLMTVFVTPFGVVAAVYLREYARQGWLTRTIRIAVNNLAGVPSIVFGLFGLGFFVYFLGASIDQAFYQEALPSPTFGTPGILWASLTMALLTLPVVIVATEEGLTRIPRATREASLALGATKAETLWRIVLPMASPAIMTGLILAIARAAGEVAPLMLVGVVKLAPSLPLDLNAPFLHLDRKFMHLGFHIYDVGFQSPNVEAARPLVYATSFLLVIVIVVLNLTAVHIRNRLRERYKALDN
ncbi:MAG: phosphate ABC transporter permease PstA [Nevskiales bacterium]